MPSLFVWPTTGRPPSVGLNVTVALSTGLPARVTIPSTVDSLVPQPGPAASTATSSRPLHHTHRMLIIEAPFGQDHSGGRLRAPDRVERQGQNGSRPPLDTRCRRY